MQLFNKINKSTSFYVWFLRFLFWIWLKLNLFFWCQAKINKSTGNFHRIIQKSHYKTFFLSKECSFQQIFNRVPMDQYIFALDRICKVKGLWPSCPNHCHKHTEWYKPLIHANLANFMLVNSLGLWPSCPHHCHQHPIFDICPKFRKLFFLRPSP